MIKDMSSYPLRISIVTPSYNQAPFLEQAIVSVLGQGYPNLEYLIIDGGSCDGSVELINKYDPSLSYWVSERDKGHGDALQKGLQRCTGDIMGWVNSDDMLTPWSLHVVNSIFTLFPHVDWIQGIPSNWNISGQMISASPAKMINVYDYLLGEYKWIQQESTFWRRSLWEKSGGYISTDVNYMVDGELWTRFFLHSQLVYVSCVLGGWRVYNANRSGLNYDQCQLEMQNSIAKMRATCPPNVEKVMQVLRPINFISETFCFGKTVVKGMIDRFLITIFQPRLNKSCAYNVILWDASVNQWVMMRKPFR